MTSRQVIPQHYRRSNGKTGFNMNRNFLSTAMLFVATSALADTPAGPANTDPAAVKAGTYAVETTHTRTQFAISHLGFSEWYGDFTGTSGTLSIDPKNIAATRLDITIPVSSVSTTNAKLDEELKSAAWLGAEQFPTMRFVSTKIARTGAKAATISGNLTLHGVTRPVVLAATFNGAGVNPLSKAFTVGFNASTAVKRSDYGVKAYVPLVGDEVTIRISAAFEQNAS
jgi:polyisoprenoid-binding protein YceI